MFENTDLERQMRDWRLTTAEIFYHMPDHPALLQTYVWQDYDLAPQFPQLSKFLGFWVQKLDGKLHSVYVARKKLITAAEFKAQDGVFWVH